MLSEVDKFLGSIFEKYGIEDFVTEIVVRAEAYELISELGMVYGPEITLYCKGGKVRIVNAASRPPQRSLSS